MSRLATYRVPLLRPSVLAVVLALSGPAAFNPVFAQAQEAVQRFDIPAGPLDVTLTRIARQSGHVISIQPDLVRGRPRVPMVQSLVMRRSAVRLRQRQIRPCVKRPYRFR